MASGQFPVAIIGMATKLPGAETCEEFWNLLKNRRDTVAKFPQERISDIEHVTATFRGQLVDEDNPYFTGSFFQSVDTFDAKLFQINPKEALFIEPEQRLFLEATWEAIEDAGYASTIRGSNTGVYVGNTVNKYKYILTENHPSISHGNHSPFISSRISYIHNLQGPAMMIATGCSSSLLAVHVACQGLLSGDCDMAIAGGITLDLLPISAKTDIWNQLGITAPGVKCRAFDASAKGIAKAEGCGVVILKPLEKAEKDGDQIYGILEATTSNQDGHSNGITAPHPGAQAKMLVRAWNLANINPDRLGYFEAHGTGTELGDPIEISGITTAFKTFGISYDKKDAASKIPISSVKANIGHLADGAAGVVSLIKVLMCLKKEKIPPAINFTQPNPHINWASSPVYVNTTLKEWPSLQGTRTRYASISAFGLLGTNVHAVVREYNAVHSSVQYQECQLLTLTANTKQSLVNFVGKIARYFQQCEAKSYSMLRNVCFTLNTGREQKRFKYRAVALASTWEHMSKALEELCQELNSTAPAREENNAKECKQFIDFGYTTLTNFKLPNHFRSITKPFLDGQEICWRTFYAEENGLNKVGLLPNYAFDRTRFWPAIGKMINNRLLQLEHGLAQQDHIVAGRFEDLPNGSSYKECITNAEGEKMDSFVSSTPSNVNVETFIHGALNEVLSTDYDWQKMADENLFALGMDSLLFTQLLMKLQNALNYTLTLGVFHNNPTCAGLIDVITKHTDAQQQLDETTKETRQQQSKVDVKLIVGDALNDSLATNYDWNLLQNENLFTLGFDSLAWTQVNNKLSNVLTIKKPLSLTHLREFPTYKLLCELIIAHLNKNDSPKEIGNHVSQAKETIFEENTTFPLSFSQNRLWVMEEMAVTLCAYNATNCLRITGSFHPEAFVSAANTVLSRHGAFFTIITDTKEGPTQAYDWQADVSVEEVDMKQFGAQAEEVMTALYRDDYKTRFDLRAGPLVRCRLYHLPDEVFYFTMVVHHIIFDGWSHFVFYNELWNCYKELCEGKKVKSDLQRPLYAEFAEQEQHGSLSSEMESHIAYWKNKLAVPLPLTTFPGDKKRPPIFTYKGKRITRFLENRVFQVLNRFHSEKYTVFIKLLSVVYVLLHRYTGDRDLIIGTPVAGRNDIRYRHVIGCFVNTLALRIQIPDQCDFKHLLDVVSAVFLEAFDNQTVPFDHIVSQLNLPRDTSITPIFSVNVCYHNTEIKSEHTSLPSSITVDRRLQHNETTKWDMQFDFLQESEGMRFTLEYYSDLFSDQYAERLVNDFIRLIQTCCENQNTPLVQLGLRATEQKQKKLPLSEISILQGTIRENEKSLPVLLKESLQTNANRTAVIEANKRKITHEELLHRAMEHSWFLRKVCKLPKQSRIGLLVENCAESIEYILASVFSGLVYVPMDTGCPQSRLEHICNEADIKAIVFNKLYIAMANYLHWACPAVQSIICVDSQDFFAIPDSVGSSPLMDVELWNCVANNAKDDIESGGWKSSYTGEHMSVKEMEEYADNVLTKLKDYLNPTTRVLEIGCASGLTVQKLCPLVAQYVATDLSDIMTKRLLAELEKKSVTNVKVLCAPADELERMLQGRLFDVIIMNSVVHCFPGYNYLRSVFKSCENMLAEGGVIFLGDVMDLDLKEKLTTSVKSFKKAHPECRVKIDWRNELFLSRTFLQHLCDSSKTLKLVKTSRKKYTVVNELTEFRFDALFTKSIEYHPSSGEVVQKQVFALKDVSDAVMTQDKNALLQIVCEWSREVQLEDEAYVLYTSGTTGTPKGVIIGHEALVNYVTWATKAYQFHSTTITPFFAPLTFDFTITSIFPPLLGGSVIQIFEPFRDSYQMLASSTEITIAKYSPLQLDTILSTSTDTLSASTFILGGEELTSNLLEKLKKNKGDKPFVVWNEYGPTEATVGCVVRCLKSDELPLKECAHIPIGKPIDNVTIAVVRNQQHLVPLGAKGHLAIGGKCLCLDFAGSGASRDAKRNKSFTASCWGRPGEQMLLTEDVVQIVPPSGDLIYFGRDRGSETTKVNGVRVDLMEVQHMIEADPAVASAWVCTFIHEGYTLLGAAVKLKNNNLGANYGDYTWKQSLLSSLAQVLPVRCIPKVFVHLSTAPTNKNGKKDTDYLQKLFLAEIIADRKLSCNVTNSSNASKYPASTAKLQQIWQSILPVDHLPKPEEDFFFDLSGDSLQAIHLVRKMRDEGFQVSVTDIFQNPSIQKLAPILEKSNGKSDCIEVPPEMEETPFRPTPIVQLFFERSPQLKQPDRFSLSALLQFHNEISPEILEKALKSIIKKHGSLRSRFGVEDGQVFQQVLPMKHNELKVEMQQIEKTEDNLTNEPLFIELCDRLEQSTSLANGHLMNSAIINVMDPVHSKQQEHFALLVVHHVAVDIVSWEQLLVDLATALRRLSKDATKEPELEKCQTSYRTYCKELETETERVFVDEIEYWKRIEEEYKTSGRLVQEDKQSTFHSAKWVSEKIDANLLRSTSNKLGCSEENILLTAFGRAIASIHGHNKTSICLESHGRQLMRVDSTSTVGWCTSSFPVILDTPLSGDLVNQVKELGQTISDIPNHGLGFGLLKSKKALTMSLPKIMFVYQGSMDASTKTTFEAGCFNFDHIPWIEVMLNELKEGRFHRHPEEYLEYDLEIIAWIHGGELKFGCLFDSEVVKEEVIKSLIYQAQLNIMAMAERAKTKPINLEIISAFNITPECIKCMKESLTQHAIIADQIRLQPPEQMLQVLCTADSIVNQSTADVTVIIPRPKSTIEANELVKACGQPNGRVVTSKTVILVNTEHLPNTAKFSRLLPLDQVSLEVSSENLAIFYDNCSDSEYNMPLTRAGYCHLGYSVARAVRACVWDSKYKVIAVDADYTLWDGECAQETVRFKKGNYELHEFLLKKKAEGMLLVILSKNKQEDIDDVFERQKNEMNLKKADFTLIVANWESKWKNIRHVSNTLNLGIDSFVFIDDNLVECEEMIHHCPEVLTLQLPSIAKLIAPLLQNLWALDRAKVSVEASQRTEIYRSELQRQVDLQVVQTKAKENNSSILNELLLSWAMQLEVCKTNIGSLKRVKSLYTRASELLMRTNQFKMNDLNTDLGKFDDDDIVWLVSLKDNHGTYGVVSVVMMKKLDVILITQWVLSCRALGRGVEVRILEEIHKEAKTVSNATRVKLAINKTTRNTPALDFLEKVNIDASMVTDANLKMVCCDKFVPMHSSEPLHNVKEISNVNQFFQEGHRESQTSHHIFDSESTPNCNIETVSKGSSIQTTNAHENFGESPQQSSSDAALMELNEWIRENWSKSQKQQTAFHNTFPIITGDAQLEMTLTGNRQELYATERETVLRTSWMEVLQIDKEPEDSDNFVQCGGNSFSAVYLVSTLRRLCSIEISILNLLQNNTYAEIKKMVEQARPLNVEPISIPQPKHAGQLPLSAAQQRMVLMQQTNPESTAYVETLAFRVEKDMDPKEIISILLQRHPILKSKIAINEETLEYSISTDSKINTDVKLEVTDGRNVTEDFLKITTPVLNVTDSSFQARFIKASEESVLALHIHHVIVDDITLTNIRRDMEQLIDGKILNDSESNGSDNYAEYVDQEMSYMLSKKHSDDKEFWREKFDSLPADSDLAIRPKADSTNFDTTVFRAKHSIQPISDQTANELEQYCRTHGLTEFQYYLSCVAVVLQRYLGVEEITLAIPVTTRTENHKNSDGLFVNTVLCRTSVDHALSFKEHTKTVAAQWLETLSHSNYPLDHVIQMLWKSHGKNSSSFCSVMFNYTTQNLKANELNVLAKHAKMPLSLDVVKYQSSQTLIVAEWADQYIEDDIAERLISSVFQLCTTAYKQDEKRLCNIQVLSNKERSLLKSVTTTSTVLKTDSLLPVHFSFEEFVETNPHATAVVINDRHLSYRELDEISSRISYALLDEVAQDELQTNPVVILAEKNEFSIAAILGVWKSGGHFLPVGKTNQGSVKTILARNKPAAILTNLEADTVRLSEEEISKCPFFMIDDLAKRSRNKRNQAKINVSADDLAYIIQTSGSTGDPKQCKISHRSLRIIANAWKQKYAMTEFKVSVLQWAPLSFDVFVGDIVRALVCVSGQLIICPEEKRLDIPYILHTIKKHHITMAEVTPLFGQQLVENAHDNQFNSMKLFILGSDVLQRHVYRSIKDRFRPDQRILNSYGTTEATIDSAFFEGDILPTTRSGTVPIGKPLPGVQLHVLDSKTLLPCPIGTIGELYIAGDVLASGDVDLISVSHLGCHALKTGDAACVLPSGDIELMGRMDNMVKLRGFRISLVEIGSKITEKIDFVKQACVVPQHGNDNKGTEFLCAFLVVDDIGSTKITIDKNYICSKLKDELPYYMLPDMIHIIPEIPLSGNGKVDYKALPDVSSLMVSKVPPKQQAPNSDSSVMATLKTLFAEALGLSDSCPVDTQMTLMEQGAHSLILVRFSTLIAQKTSFHVTIADIFSYPTISALEKFVAQSAQSCNTISPEIFNATVPSSNNKTIAITGIGLRLPGGIVSLPQLWDVLEIGEDIMGDFPKSRTDDILNCVTLENEQTLSQAETFQGAFFERIDGFDNRFFKIPPGEAKFMSPEQRMFLQVATEALAESKSLSEVKGSKIGVFVGATEIWYSQLQHPDEATCISGLLPGMIATRVAYQWDLKGPTMLIDTACSSSLMALKEACESIKRGECEGALVGGVNLVMYPSRTGVWGENSILSEDFRCKAFDKDATGTAVGEGVLCLYAEPLEKAIAEKKSIYGVVHSIASNNVGRSNGITAPSANAQRDVIQDALNSAKIRPSDVTYIEGHGTGTKLGDRIELSALRSTFEDRQQSEVNLSIGSVKSVFGHLDSTAGMLGVFKTLASLGARKIPPTAHFYNPHPEILNSRLEVPNRTIDWRPSSETGLRIAGVSSFGLTGTNCHAIITEPPHSDGDDEPKIPRKRNHHLLIASSSLNQLKNQLHIHKIHIGHFVMKLGTSTIAGLCLSVATRLKQIIKLRSNLEWRLVITAENASEMLEVVKIAESALDLRAMKQLAELRRDIEFYCPGDDDVTTALPDVTSFLKHGTINVHGLFYGEHQTIQFSKGVTLAIYNESRHWLDATEKVERSTLTMDICDLLTIKMNETRELVRKLPLAPAAGLQETLGRFCSAIIVKLFLGTPLKDFLLNEHQISIKKAFSLCEMLPKYEKLFFVMVRELWQNDWLKETGTDKNIHCLDSFVFKCKNFLDVDPEVIADHSIKSYPSWADCFRFPLYCSRHLEKVVRGKMSPLSVIYPRGDMNFMFQFDKLGDLLGDVYYNMYMQLISSYAKQLSSQGRRVRILEVGAGVGHVTRQLLPKLENTSNIEYWFTDLGKAFVEHAKKTFSDYLSMMKFATFDITKSAPKQGLLGSFDIIVSYNVIHTTQSIIESVLNLKSCLAGDGKLFIIESAKNETWATLAWGILDGWWYFNDYDLRPAEPMMEPEKWEKVLKSVGFQSVATCPTQNDERKHVEKFLFLCSSKLTSDAKKYAEISSSLGWWETDIGRFDTVQKADELQDELDDDESASQLKDKGYQAIFEELKKIWTELLEEDNIHPEDDFNSLGGESLLAIQMMNLVKRRIGFQLEIADTFGYPTLGSLAGFITDELFKNEGAEVCKASTLPSIEETNPSRDEGDQSNESDRALENLFRPADLLACKTTQKEHSVLLMFPGQGSQKIGMCASLKNSKEARNLFSLAEETLGYNVLDICIGDENILKEKLKSTEFVQVALFVGCLAKIEQLKTETPEILANVTHVAGLSVGEFAALVYAGAISFDAALKIVSQRGRAMENVVRESPTGMVSVFGPDCKQLENFLKKSFPDMIITTYLADNQHTVGGTSEECDAFVEALSGEKQKVMNVIDVRKLRVAGAFHSPYMKQASQEINNLIMRAEFSKPTLPIIMNVNGDLAAEELGMKDLLCQQLTAPVKWKQSVVRAYGLGVRSFVEIAPGRVLSSIVKKRIKECQDCDVEYIQV
ncbi:uncharacterized protein LOC114525576 [Dendronephthya gigantea]|uniref:uncharacterized protein LOC114525576 n=1 Tax=Dendronephthya gigantea TaxID=151771 RepID=UPI00106D0BC3|nr:uncharacterized protein LOC114525576 [Dendronephthya gigantea]